MPSFRPHPRAHENTGEKAPVRPASKPAESAIEPTAKPSQKALESPKRPPASKDRIAVGTKLEPSELAALDRKVKELSGVQPSTRSFALRWLVQKYCK